MSKQLMKPLLRDVESWSSDSRKLFGIMVASMFLVLIEVVTGVIIADVGMMIDGLHAVFHVMSFGVSFLAMRLAVGEAAPRPFSYGYDRVEVLAAFTNGCFLLFVVVFLSVHVLHGAFGSEHEDHHHVSANLYWTCIVRCIVQLVGVALFWKETKVALKRIGRSDVYLTAHQENIGSCVLQMLGDLIVSFCFLISSTSLKHACWLEPFLSTVGMLAVFKMTIPLMTSTARVLLQGVPVSKSALLQKAVREISFFDGVLNVVAWNAWSMSMSGDHSVIGTIELKVIADADVQTIVRRVRANLAPHVTDLTVQATRDVVLDWTNTSRQRSGHTNVTVLQDASPIAPAMTERFNRGVSDVSSSQIELKTQTLVV